MKKEKTLLEELLESHKIQTNLPKILKELSKEEILIPFYNNHLVELYTEENLYYIPVFTNESHIKNIEYTRLDKTTLKTIIDDIYSIGKYHAISINPFTNDFIMNDKMIFLMSTIYNKDND